MHVKRLTTCLFVDDIAAAADFYVEHLAIASGLHDDPWGERSFQVHDPNGVTVQLVQWLKPRPGA